jgi:hypothetical protein
MHRRAPHVPPAVQLAFAGTQGPRVPPGSYTVRMEKDGRTYTMPLTVGLDRRVSWTLADREAQYEAAMKVYALFNDESALFGRIAGLREQVAAASQGRAAADPLKRSLADFDGKLDALRKRIVATTEGGAITGEERLREHTDQLYGAITSWDGPPSRYQLENIEALRGELRDISDKFDRLTAAQLPELNKALSGAGAHPLEVPPQSAFEDGEAPGDGAGGRVASGQDPDARGQLELPRNLRLFD